MIHCSTLFSSTFLIENSKVDISANKAARRVIRYLAGDNLKVVFIIILSVARTVKVIRS